MDIKPTLYEENYQPEDMTFDLIDYGYIFISQQDWQLFLDQQYDPYTGYVVCYSNLYNKVITVEWIKRYDTN